MRSIRLRPFCKVNLCLEILGRRDDGYHDLATVFQAISLADELRVRALETAEIEIRVPGGGAPEGSENLCWQAAEAYRKHRGWPEGVGITLTKAIPASAGLGGGSSDAAAVLMALAQIDADAPDWETLSDLAAGIGADVPFFLMAGTALGLGRGDELQPLPEMPPCRIVLTRPDLAVDTAEAYGMLAEADFTDGGRAEAMTEALRRGALLRDIAPHVYNGFSTALTNRWPVLGELIARMEGDGALAAEVTGSGSAVFGLFDDEQRAEAAARALADDGFWTRIAEPAPCGATVIE